MLKELLFSKFPSTIFSFISISAINLPGFSIQSPGNTLWAIRTSTDLAVGTQLLSKDDNYVGGDITLVHSSQDKENTIQVWDYAAVDGDYVQIKVNGSPITDSFMITHEPKTITVPTVGTVEVIGTKDGGGGITYAIRYGVNGMTYYNGTTEGNENKYTLIRQ